ncbi:MAG TPA: hypothetical protein DCY07_00320 [Rhodospirillaceae bacterium]|nr:hypothetical protein [Rhodospirillaceae bacterium]
MSQENEEYPTFNNAPIKEAIFNIAFQRLPNEAVDEFEKVREKLSNDFSEIMPIEAHQKTINFGSSEEALPPDQSWKHGCQIWSTNKLELYTARLDGFSYHKLKPYKDGRTAIKKTLEGWNSFASIVSEPKIVSMSVRNINVIEIPEISFDLNKYFEIYPKLPDALEKNEISNVYMKTVLNFREQKATGTVTLAGMPNNERGAQILLDIEVTKPFDKDSSIEDVLLSLNSIKDKIFFTSHTPECRKLFK